MVEVPSAPGAEAGAVEAWHHRDLRADVRPGDRVHVHERHSALAGRFGTVSLMISRGVGPVPDPVALEVWSRPAGGTVIDLRTGALLSPSALGLVQLS